MAPTITTSATLNRDPTYHADPNAAYILPNDDTEHARLEQQARHLSAIMNHQIIHAPLPASAPHAARILDVGCGTGIVTDDLGRRFPHAAVYGLDLSPAPAVRETRPPNVRFLRGNILQRRGGPGDWEAQDGGEGLPREDGDGDGGLFDLIFSRLLVCGMDDWPGYIRECASLLRTGGFVEIHDVDWVFLDRTGARIGDDWRWLRCIKEASEPVGLDWECGSKAKGWMEDAGLEVVEVKEYRWPVGGAWESSPVWREWGDFAADEMVGLVWHMIPKLLDGKGYSDEQVAEMREEAKRSFTPEEGKHWMMRVTVGKKT